MSARPRPEGVLAALVVSALLAAPSARAQAQACTPNNLYFWNNYVGGSGADEVDDLQLIKNASAPAGSVALDILITGQTASGSFGDGDNETPSAATAFVARMKPDGTGLRKVRRFSLGTPKTTSTGVRMALSAESDAVYVVGRVNGTEPFDRFPVTLNTPMQGDDAFLARLTPDLDPVWIMYLSGPSNDEALGVTVSGSTLYVVGRTQSGRSLNASAPVLGTPGTGYDAFVSRVDLTPTGRTPATIVWTRLVGSSAGGASSGTSTPTGDDAASAVVVLDREVCVGGVIGGDVRATDGAYVAPTVTPFHGIQDGFVLRLEPDGSVQNMVNLGGSRGPTEVSELLVRPDNTLLAVGDTNAQDFPKDANARDDQDVFAYALDTSGLDVPGQQLRLVVSGNQKARGRAALDAKSGKLFIGGSTDQSLFDGKFQERVFDDTFDAANGDGFVVSLDVTHPPLKPDWGSYLGGGVVAKAADPESVTAVVRDETANLLVVAGNSSAGDVLHANLGYQRTAPGSRNGVMFGRLPDLSPPTPGIVVAQLEETDKLGAAWSGFNDPETGISGYEWSILKGSERVQDFTPVKDAQDNHTRSQGLSLVPGESYTVELRALNGGSCAGPAAVSNPVKEGGTSSPSGGSSPRSPLGWTCGVTASGAPLSGLGLAALLRLASRSRRRSRGAAAR